MEKQSSDSIALEYLIAYRETVKHRDAILSRPENQQYADRINEFYAIELTKLYSLFQFWRDLSGGTYEGGSED